MEIIYFDTYNQPLSCLGKRDNLPGYYYRDDGYKVYNAMKDYIQSILLREEIYGPNITDATNNLKNDEIIKALERELKDPGYNK